VWLVISISTFFVTALYVHGNVSETMHDRVDVTTDYGTILTGSDVIYGLKNSSNSETT